MYQVGHANDPYPDDPRFDDLNAAIAHAYHVCHGDRVMAVWKWDGANPTTVCLIYQGDIYERPRS